MHKAFKLFIIFLLCASSLARAEVPKNFSVIKEVIMKVIVHHLLEHPPKSTFSISIDSTAVVAKERDLPEEMEALIMKEIGDSAKLYVRASTLTFPSDDKENKLKKIHDSDGNRVPVLDVNGITFVDEQTLLVSWDLGSGFLSGHGGDYKVALEKGEIEILRGNRSYDR